jgi:hypothetical protein
MCFFLAVDQGCLQLPFSSGREISREIFIFRAALSHRDLQQFSNRFLPYYREIRQG